MTTSKHVTSTISSATLSRSASILDGTQTQELCLSFARMSGVAIALLDSHAKHIIESGWADMVKDFEQWLPDLLSAGETRHLPSGDRFILYDQSQPLAVACVSITLGENTPALLCAGPWLSATHSLRDLRQTLGQSQLSNRLNALQRIEQLPVFNADGCLRAIQQLVDFAHIISAQCNHQQRFNKAFNEAGRETTRDHDELTTDKLQLQVLVDHSPASLALFDREMRYLMASKRWLADYGLEDADIIGRSHYEIFPEISDEWKDVHQRGLRGETVSAYRDEFKRLDGHSQWLRWQVRPWYEADHRIGGIVIFTEDMTRQVELEKVVFEHLTTQRELTELRLNDRTRELYEAQRLAKIGNWQYDRSKKTLFWSPEIFRILELNAETIEPSYKRYENCVHADDRAELRRALRASLGSGQMHSHVHRLMLGDGKIKWVEHAWETVPGDDRRACTIRGTLRDVTQQVLDRESLLIERQRYVDIIWSTGAGTWELDTRDNNTVFNDTWAQLIGYSLEELQPLTLKTWQDLTHPDDRQVVEDKLRRVLSQEISSFEAEIRMQHKAGHWVWIQDRGKVVRRSENGYPLKIVGTHLDITQRKDFESDLVQLVEERTSELQLAKEHAERANEAKTEFLSNISHELRTPLHAITSFTNLITRRNTDEKIERFLFNIDISTKRLTSLIEDLLDITNIASGKKKYSFMQGDLVKLTRRVISDLKPSADEKQQQIILRTESPLLCDFDEQLIQRVISKLISNSIKYSPPDSTIVVDFLIQPSRRLYDKSPLAEIIVTDEGVGIPKDQLESIFHPFEQSRETKTKAGGSGLGLSISSKIVLLHRGKIWVNSPPEGKLQGSEFHVILPQKQHNSLVRKLEDIEAATYRQ